MPKYAWKVTKKDTLQSAVEFGEYAVTYKVGEFVSEHPYIQNSFGLGLFVFATREHARKFARTREHVCIWRCEVEGARNTPYNTYVKMNWPKGTQFCKSVKLLHKQ